MDVVSWNAHNINDTTNYVSFLYSQAYGLPKVNAQSVDRAGRWPTIAGINRPGRVMYLEIIIRNLAQLTAKQVELQQWFDPEDETPKKLVVEDLGGGTGGGNDRYVYAICEELQAAANDENNYTFVATLRVHGDVRWRENTASTQSWAVTGTADTESVTNNGKDDAYPVFTITPTAGKTGGYAYRRYCNIKWIAADGYTRYPVDIVANALDTATLVSGGKMQADGDDLRVWVDGVQVVRWLQDINNATTQVWVNLDFQPTQSFELATAIASGATPPDTIDIVDDISAMPDEGYVFVSDELFHYTGKNNANRQFTGITRGELGTSTAAHATNHLVLWLQHVVEIFYGNASAAAPIANDTYKPIFSLASTNASWVYADFGDGPVATPCVRAGAWAQTARSSTQYTPYTADAGATADPWSEIGLLSNTTGLGVARALWYIYNPCGINHVNFTNGEKYQTDDNSIWKARVVSAVNSYSWKTEYTIVKPDPAESWDTWSDDEDLTANSKYVGFELITTGAGDYLEVADCTLTISNYPVIVQSAEIGNYDLDCTITNNTTGDIMAIRFNMALDEDLRVDSYNKTIVYLLNNSNQLQALTLTGGARKDWLKLQPGANELQFDDTGTNGVTIALSWEERHYQ